MQNTEVWPGWQTMRVIGRGSYGAVYEIRRDIFGQVEKAAVKCISIPQNESDIADLRADGYDSKSITETYRERMRRITEEYSLMHKMNGTANVVNCDDLHCQPHADGIGWDIYIKMELLRALPDVMPQQADDVFAAKVGMDICRALKACARYNIVHRDIKPQNLFLSANGDFKLGDFGIARTMEQTVSGTRIGTFKYMAPEVYNSRPYNRLSDIYALGLVLYWLMNERRIPFVPLPPQRPTSADEKNASERRFAGEELPAPLHGSRALKKVILKACEFEPADRYQSAEEMLEALRKAVPHAEEGEFGGPEGPKQEDTMRMPAPERRSDSGHFSAQPRTGSRSEPAMPAPQPQPQPRPEQYSGMRTGGSSSSDNKHGPWGDSSGAGGEGAPYSGATAAVVADYQHLITGERTPYSGAAAAGGKKTGTETPNRKKILGISAVAAAVCAAAVILLLCVIRPNAEYRNALALMEDGNYSRAVTALESLNGYKDSEEQIELCEAALDYEEAAALMDEGSYEEAIAAFEALGDYEDSEELASQIRHSSGYLNSLSVGDTLVFGSYEQDNDTSDGAEPIVWRVLDKEDDHLVVISESGLDSQQYDSDGVADSWENCSLRKWLNDDFCSSAFSEEEQEMIATAAVTADNDPEYWDEDGADTQDKIFLLGISEAEAYFDDAGDRMCVPTDYAVSRGASANSNYSAEGGKTCRWWLRSGGSGDQSAAYVRSDGKIYSSGDLVIRRGCCIRPAMWIRLEF